MQVCDKIADSLPTISIAEPNSKENSDGIPWPCTSAQNSKARKAMKSHLYDVIL